MQCAAKHTHSGLGPCGAAHFMLLLEGEHLVVGVHTMSVSCYAYKQKEEAFAAMRASSSSRCSAAGLHVLKGVFPETASTAPPVFMCVNAW